MTDKLHGLKPGDRVRVTFEARVTKLYANDGVMLALEGVDPVTTCLPYSPGEVASPALQIERIEPPLKVGDRVARKDRPARDPIEMYALRVLFVQSGFAVCELINGGRDRDGKPFGVVNLDDLERIP